MNLPLCGKENEAVFNASFEADDSTSFDSTRPQHHYMKIIVAVSAEVRACLLLIP